MSTPRRTKNEQICLVIGINLLTAICTQPQFSGGSVHPAESLSTKKSFLLRIPNALNGRNTFPVDKSAVSLGPTSEVRTVTKVWLPVVW